MMQERGDQWLSRPARRAAGTMSLLVLGLVVTTSADAMAYRDFASSGLHRTEWAQMLRSCGYWPLWGVVGAAMFMIDWRRKSFAWPRPDRWTRLVMLWASTAAAGLIAEAFKLMVRRERPELNDGAYAFRSITDQTLSTIGLGMPSSHAAVAFAAAWTLTRLHPGAWPVWMALAGGCAMTRLLDRAHFLSDVYVGALVGIGAAELLWRAHRRNHGRLGARTTSTTPALGEAGA